MKKMTAPPPLTRLVQRAPMLSYSASNLLQVMTTASHELEDVIRLVKHDSILTAQVLRVVNSPVFAPLQPITTIERAVLYLGEKIIVGIAVADSAVKLLHTRLEGYEAKQGDLWRHDLFTAIASREVIRYAKNEIDAGVAFTGGLLHDIGKAIISDCLAGTSREVLYRIEQGVVSDYITAEQELLGYDHAVAGSELAVHWGLPEALQAVVRYHHQPELAPKEYRGLVYAVHLGDIIAMMWGQDTGSDGMQYQLDTRYTAYFEISPEQLAMIMLTAQDAFEEINQDFLPSKEAK